MQVSFGHIDDVFHNLQTNGSYEWWYFDGISTDSDYSFVIIFFVGIPMSATYISSYSRSETSLTPIENCGISVNVYHKNKRIFTTLQEGSGNDNDFSNTKCQGVFGANSFNFDEETNSYYVTIDTSNLNIPTTLKGSFKLSISAPIDNTHCKVTDHLWTLVAPRARFNATFNLFEYDQIVLNETINGFAYHDHNCGVEPLHLHFSQWYWGNLQSEKYSLVFYDVLAFEHRNCEATVTLSTDDSFEELTVVDVKYSGYKFSFMGIRYATKYLFLCTTKSGKNVKIHIAIKRIKEQGPFYLRFSITAEVHFDSEIYKDFVGIAEYMDAQTLQKQWILPFLKVPLIQVNSKKTL